MFKFFAQSNVYFFIEKIITSKQMKKFGISGNLMHSWHMQARQFPSQIVIGSNMDKQRIPR